MNEGVKNIVHELEEVMDEGEDIEAMIWEQQFSKMVKDDGMEVPMHM